jgi:hypothetical protein
MENYKLQKLGGSVERLSDNAFIPFDPANTDYQAFLRWCDEGNVPEPADEVTE